MSFHRPESLASDVIDRLFSALMLRYGSPFLDRWRELDLGVVKSDWARMLAGFRGAALRYALDNLPEKPPTVIEFRKIANQAPASEAVAAIGYSARVRGPTLAEREQLRRMAQDIRKGRFFAKPGRDWAYDLVRCHEQGWKNGAPWNASPIALAMAREAIATDPYRHDRQPLEAAA